MALFETWLKSDLKKPLKVEQLRGNLFSSDNGGNQIGVEVLDNGSPATLTGGVMGYVIRADGATVAVNGSLSGNRASIVLPASAYVVTGQVSIAIKVGSTTVGACTAYVYRTTTDSLVDPGHVIPSIEELLAKIADCEAATTAATAAASSANAAASTANTAATGADTAAGSANTAAGSANSAAGSANTAASTANAAAQKINGMTVEASQLTPGSTPTAVVSEVSGHKHIAFGIPKGDSGEDGTDATPALITVDYSDLTFPVAAGTMCYHSGLLHKANQAIATSEAWTAAHWTQTTIEAEQSALEMQIEKSAKSETPNETDADLYVCDENGNVITRFKNGEIETKNFNSKYTPEALSQYVDSGSDLMIADEQGNAVMLLRDGNMRMKNFSSDNGIYEKRFDYEMTAGTETITHFFPAGTRLAFHLTDHNDRQRDGVRSNKVTYKYTDTSGTTRTLGTEYGYTFPEYVLQYDAVSVSVQYWNDLSYANTVLSFKVYAMASFPREPHILSVSASGGKDFTSIREAVEYALQTADELNRFEIQIFPGSYDILSYYTAEEIAVEGFIGLTISNGISLVGMGHRAEVILTASMDTTEYSSTQRNYVSTLNIKGNTSIRNMTIVGENIRYAVHDDMSMMAHQNNTHIFENVEFVGINMTSSNDGDISYGAGGADMKNLIFRNCDFSDALTLHTTTDLQHEYTVNFENCRARLMQFGDYNSGIPTHVYLHNCNVSRIRLGISGTHDQYMLVQGEGVSGAMIESPAGYVYALDGVHKFAGSNVSAGTAVKLTSTMDAVEASTALNTIYGISIGTLDGTTYVQTEGWINSNTLGLSGLSVGDYLTIDNTGAVVSGGTSSNAIAIVKHINSNGVAFAKLMI